MSVLPGKKKSWNTKKNGPKLRKKPPPAVPLDDLTVRDCLTWNSSDKKKSASTGETQNSEPFVYRSVLVKRDRPTDGGSWEENRQPDIIHRKEIRDEGTVADAVRGWPGYRTGEGQQGVNQEGSSEWNSSKLNNDDLLPDIFKDLPNTKAKSSQPQRSTKKTSGNDKRHARKGISQEDNGDAAMGDLMSQRFHHEYLAQREEEMAKEKRRKELKAQAVAEGRRAARDRTDIKANRTSQLRSIALAEKVETSPFDLWKMDRFKHAQSHVSTFRTGRSGGGGGGARKNPDDEGHDPCTCDNGQVSYDDDLGGGISDNIGAEGDDVQSHGYSHYLSAL